jgi:DNA primase large subunit
MQVARAGGARADTTVSAEARYDEYAPLYLSSGLGNLAFDVEEILDLALSRLRLLKAADAARGPSPSGTAPSSAVPDAIRDAIRKAERDHGFHIPPVGNADRDDVIVRDQAAHFVVRLALCKSHDQRTWFLARECDLFMTRLDRSGADFALKTIQAADGPDIRPVPTDLLEAIRPDLDAVARGVRKATNDQATHYYQVAFEHVAPLVRSRRVLVRAGFAYVPERNIRDVVAAQFRAKLNLGLMTASKAVGLAEQDSRMRPILEAVRAHHAAEESNRPNFEDGRGIENISLNQLNTALPSMPLCMLNMMNRLRADHHLRHSGRMQLGLFLKGCGLSMDESLLFWRTEFAKGGVQGDKFDKQYAYNIRHHYGKEGKRKNLPPFPCIRVINDRPGPGEHHGCPYREFEEGRLKDALGHAGTPKADIPSIAAKAREGNFQGACGLCFASTQPGRHELSDSGMPVFFPSHPNEYFIEARRRLVAPETGIENDDEMGTADMPPPGTAPMDTQDAISDEDALMTPAKRTEGSEDANTPAAKRSKPCENVPEADTTTVSRPVVKISAADSDTAKMDKETVSGAPAGESASNAEQAAAQSDSEQKCAIANTAPMEDSSEVDAGEATLDVEPALEEAKSADDLVADETRA